MRLGEPYRRAQSQAGEHIILAVQIEGFSRSGQRQGWKNFDVRKIEVWTELKTGFVRLEDREVEQEALYKKLGLVEVPD